MNEDEEIVQAFLEESRENLDQLDRDLVELESRPEDPELLARVYRAIHTIKGTCGFLGFHRLEKLSHVGEDLLDAVRSGEVALDPGVTSSLLGLMDATRATLDCIEATGQESDEPNDELIAALKGHLANEKAPAGAEPVAPAGAVVTPHSLSHETTVRVDVGVLDDLMDLVGELVLTRSQIAHLAAIDDDGPIVGPHRQLSRITTELQDNVMQARLQPIGAITGKFPRIARDLAASMGKRIRVDLEGEDVGVDRAVNEALKDALLHLVRNTVDHGIESPAERTAAGKDPEGRLRISASHAGGRVHIELSDDGRGIDPDRLAERAVSAGALSRDAAEALSPESRLQLMFLPGISTKEEITTVSGRGVGMDAVRSALDQLGAGIEITSEVGKGTVFRINVPLTLAILPTILVWSGGERYALPQVHVREVVHVDPEEVPGLVDDVDGRRIHRLRGRLLPLVELAEQLGVTGASRSAEDLTIVVVEIDGRRFGIVVDGVDDPIEAVVKPLPRAVRSIGVFAGVTILASGFPALIVDLDGLAAAAGLLSPATEDFTPVEVAAAAEETSVLLATVAGGGRLAVALDSVQRLEHFPADRMQRSRGGDVVDYGDTILPLLSLAGLFPELDAPDRPAGEAAGEVPTIVCRSSAGPVGLVVERIEDVVDVPLSSVSRNGDDQGSHRFVIDNRVTELVDVEALLARSGMKAP